MTTDTPPKESQQRSREVDKDQQSATYMQAPATHFHEAPPQVEPAQRKFLMDCVRELAALLASPVTLRERAKAKGPQVVLDALPSDPTYREGKERPRRYSRTPRTKVRREAPNRPGDGRKERLTTTRRHLPSLRVVQSNLAPSPANGIIGTTPAWADVKRALARLAPLKPAVWPT